MYGTTRRQRLGYPGGTASEGAIPRETPRARRVQITETLQLGANTLALLPYQIPAPQTPPPSYELHSEPSTPSSRSLRDSSMNDVASHGESRELQAQPRDGTSHHWWLKYSSNSEMELEGQSQETDHVRAIDVRRGDEAASSERANQFLAEALDAFEEETRQLKGQVDSLKLQVEELMVKLAVSESLREMARGSGSDYEVLTVVPNGRRYLVISRRRATLGEIWMFT